MASYDLSDVKISKRTAQVTLLILFPSFVYMLVMAITYMFTYINY